MKTVKLWQSGLEMPLVGLGTWRADMELIQQTVFRALKDCGYRHIDTASNYQTEDGIGEGIQQWIKECEGKREDLFLTTKLPHYGNRPTDVERFLSMSLNKLQTDYVDLYLMHFPFSFNLDETTLQPLKNSDNSFSLDVSTDYVNTWKVLENEVKKGRIKALGVSNFNAQQLQRLYDNSEIKPAVLQVELHAYFQQKELRDLCKKLNVVVTAYSPLGSPGIKKHIETKYAYPVDNAPDLLNDQVVTDIAKKYNKTPGQVLLKHLIQENVVVIPKSTNPDRMRLNVDLFNFDLSTEDLDKLDALDKGEEGRVFDFYCFKGVENHPEYPFKKRERKEQISA